MKVVVLELNWTSVWSEFRWQILGERTLIAETEDAFQVKGLFLKHWYSKRWFRYQIIKDIK